MIEKGRHNNLAVHNRKCPVCLTHIEDETHFLINCPTYSSIRVNLMEKIDIRNEYPHTDELNFKFLMLNEDLLIPTANFITRANDVRELKIGVCIGQKQRITPGGDKKSEELISVRPSIKHPRVMLWKQIELN